MDSRSNIVEIFSTFLVFAADRCSGWTKDARLSRQMHKLIEQTPQQTNENFWVLYWYNNMQNPHSAKLAKEHLIAYLQEPCYWAAQKTYTSFATSQYKLSDHFQIAISQVDKVFKGFDPKSGFSLKNYATAIFGSAIRETLRQYHEIDICTDWGLLRKISQKRLVESLQSAGLSPTTVTAYVAAWNYFKSLYIPTQATTTRQLSRPDKQTWEAIALAYNRANQPPINTQTLESWLLSCAKAARTYLYPSLTSINTKNSSDDKDWLDNLPGKEQDSPLSQIIATEEQQTNFSYQTEINKVLVAAITLLEPQAQEILQLYYLKGLTQQQIAKQEQIQQYTVSRRLTKARELLLRSLAKWSEDTLHISMTSDILKSCSAMMEEWLQDYYKPSV